MNNDKKNLNDIDKQLDENFSRNSKKPNRFFKTKNEESKDVNLVTSYSKILTNLTSFLFKDHSKAKTTNKSSQNRPVKKIAENSVNKNSEIKEVFNSSQRCKNCCLFTNNLPTKCSYCSVTEDIVLIDNQEKKRKENVDLVKGLSRISPINFYDDKSIDGLVVPCKKKPKESFNSESLSEKYALDYLFIGTYRFISRSFIKLDEENLKINLFESFYFNLNYQYIQKLFFWEDKKNSNHVYIRIEVDSSTHNFMNENLQKIADKTIVGNFQYKSINSHFSIIIAKFFHLTSEKAKNLKRKLLYFLKNNFVFDRNLPQIFNEQREYTYQGITKKKNKGSLNHNSSLFVTNVKSKKEVPLSLKDCDIDMEVREIKQEKELEFKIDFDKIKNKKVEYWFNDNETLTIYKNDLFCLKEKSFLNDKIIEFYLLYIKYNLIPEDIKKKTYIFSTFFFSKMLSSLSRIVDQSNPHQEIYNSVKNWTKNVDIFNYDFLIVPIFRDYHWSLALICYPFKTFNDDFEEILDDKENQKSCIIFMDSMGRDKNFSKFSKVLKIFLEQECYNKKQISKKFNENTLITLIPKVPCQLNGYDCGIFVLHYVELFLKNPSVIFGKKDLKQVSLEFWFKSSSLNNKRKEIFAIFQKIFLENDNKAETKFESDEDSKMKSDDEIEIITDNDNNLFTSDDEDMIE